MSFAVPRSDRRTSGVGDFESSDFARNIGSLLRFGRVRELDFANRLCRVELNNGLITDDIPWINVRAGGNTCWTAPSVDEVVLVLSPSGELNNAVAMPALQSNQNGSWPYGFTDLEFEWGGLGEPREALWRWLFADGALMENDPERHQWRVEQRQARIRGQEIVHIMSDKFVYIDGAKDGSTVHVKANLIKLEGDVQITGQLLQGGRIVGTEPDGQGLKDLQLVGDPIKLNGGGGVLGIAAGLLGSVGGSFALGTLGTAMNSFGGNIFEGLQSIAGDFLEGTGITTLTQNLPISGFSGALNLTGLDEVLGTVFDGLGFAGQILEDLETGELNLVPGLTTGTGLDLQGAFTGLSAVANAFGIQQSSDFTALGQISGLIQNGNVGLTDFFNVLTGDTPVPGFTPPAGSFGQIFNLAAAATAAIEAETDGATSVIGGGNFFTNAATSIMAELYGENAPASAADVANMINNLGLVSNYDALFAAGTSGGPLIGSFINSGEITLEQVLDMAGVIQNADLSVTAGQVQGAGPADEFWPHFERAQYRPGSVTPRDLSDRAETHTDPTSTNHVPGGPVNVYDAIDFSQIF